MIEYCLHEIPAVQLGGFNKARGLVDGPQYIFPPYMFLGLGGKKIEQTTCRLLGLKDDELPSLGAARR